MKPVRERRMRNRRPAKGTLEGNSGNPKICIRFEPELFDRVERYTVVAHLSSFGEAARSLIYYAFDMLNREDDYNPFVEFAANMAEGRSSREGLMTVYIDDMYKTKMGGYGRMKMSHMIADTDEELHALARKIGVGRKHFDRDHYDVCMEMRELAIGFGAQPCSMKQLSAMLLMKRAGRRMGTPETAIDRYLAWRDSHAAPSPRRKKRA